MKILDLFCGEGGAGMGYSRAGLEVVGVDISPQPNYPFEFHQGDAIEYLLAHGHEFDAAHASPPCQAATSMSNRYPGAKAKLPQLIPATRAALEAIGAPYVIENVTGAKALLRNPALIHGGHVKMALYRPRLFETNWPLKVGKAPRPKTRIGIYGAKPDGRLLWRRADGTELRAASSVDEARDLMGMPWASWDGVREAIPPAFTELIGAQLMAHLESVATTSGGAA